MFESFIVPWGLFLIITYFLTGIVFVVTERPHSDVPFDWSVIFTWVKYLKF